MQVEYEFHELATLFPRMEDKAFSDLVEDIRKNGLREPIVRYKGKILDGRNRYLACLAAGVEPRFVGYDGADPVGFVVSANLHRRHLTESQMGSLVVKLGAYGVGRPAKAMAKAEEVAAIRASDETLTQAEIAKKVGVSRQSVSEILKPGNDLPRTPPNGGLSGKKLSEINISAKDAATLGSVGTRTIERCRAVHSTGNDRLIEALDNGSLSADKAASIASKSPEYVEAVLDSIDAGVKPAEAIRQAHKSPRFPSC